MILSDIISNAVISQITWHHVIDILQPLYYKACSGTFERMMYRDALFVATEYQRVGMKCPTIVRVMPYIEFEWITKATAPQDVVLYLLTIHDDESMILRRYKNLTETNSIKMITADSRIYLDRGLATFMFESDGEWKRNDQSESKEETNQNDRDERVNTD
jgi:hypothetical protein